MSAFVRAVGGNHRGGFREGPAGGPRGAIVFCVMYNSPSSPGSRVGNSGPSCPLYLLQWLVERYIRPLTVTTSWRPSFSLPRFASPPCPLLPPSSPGVVVVVVVDNGDGVAALSFLSHTFILFPVTSLFYSLFLWSILRVRELFVGGGRQEGTYPRRPSGRTMSHNSDNSALV